MKYLVIILALSLCMSTTYAKSKKSKKRTARKLGKVSSKRIENIQAFGARSPFKVRKYNPGVKNIKISDRNFSAK